MFEYEVIGDGGRGSTRDRFIFPPQGLSGWDGEFTHRYRDGREVNGAVSLVKLDTPRTLPGFLRVGELQFRSGLPTSVIATWGERMLAQASATLDRSHEYVVLDIISQNRFYASEGDLFEVAEAVMDKWPDAVLYFRRTDGTRPRMT